MWVDRLAVAVYECRSLERLLSYREVCFRGVHPDKSPPAEEDVQRVLTILSEADNSDYWFAVSRDGNRTAHYRGEKAHSAREAHFRLLQPFHWSCPLEHDRVSDFSSSVIQPSAKLCITS